MTHPNGKLNMLTSHVCSNLILNGLHERPLWKWVFEFNDYVTTSLGNSV